MPSPLSFLEIKPTPEKGLGVRFGRGFKYGVYFVELAPLLDASSIVLAIAEATGYQFQNDRREQKQQVLDFLANKNMLLVLDNKAIVMIMLWHCSCRF